MSATPPATAPGPPTPVAPRRQQAGSNRVAGVVAPLAFTAGLVGVWYAITYLVLTPDRRFLLPAPHEVVAAGVSPPARGDIAAALVSTFLVAAAGLAIAFVLGVGMAIAMSQARWVERSLYPWAVFSQVVPILVIVPLLGFWFGYGATSRIIVCAVIALFPLVINTLEGLAGADRRLHDLFTLAHASRWTRLVHLQLPSAVPGMLVGLRTSAGLAVIGANVGDFFFGRGTPGLGLLITRYSSRLDGAEMLAATAAACALGVAAFVGFGVAGRVALGRFQPPGRTP